ncbi:MAG TPA: ribosome maturation factor RimP [Vulgatibacter sp.]|nr:ribosome maturation factor RimP [Vulgatibacter sp.]
MSGIHKDIAERVRELAEPVVEAEGMELVDVEYQREGPRWVLRLYIDKPSGVGLDDCQTVSRQIDKLLDVEDPIAPSYSLEVSSPGLERPLKKREHFERFAGRQVEIRTFGPIGDPPRRNFKGRLLGIGEGDAIRVEIDGTMFEVPLDEVAKAHLALDLEALAQELKGS